MFLQTTNVFKVSLATYCIEMSLKCVKSCLDYIFIAGRSHQAVEGSVVEVEATMLPSQRPQFKSVFQRL